MPKIQELLPRAIISSLLALPLKTSQKYAFDMRSSFFKGFKIFKLSDVGNLFKILSQYKVHSSLIFISKLNCQNLYKNSFKSALIKKSTSKPGFLLSSFSISIIAILAFGAK